MFQIILFYRFSLFKWGPEKVRKSRDTVPLTLLLLFMFNDWIGTLHSLYPWPPTYIYSGISDYVTSLVSVHSRRLNYQQILPSNLQAYQPPSLTVCMRTIIAIVEFIHAELGRASKISRQQVNNAKEKCRRRNFTGFLTNWNYIPLLDE